MPMSQPLTPRPAATLLLLRDSHVGPEVLLLKRTADAAFMPEYYVFPGGAVDTADSRLPSAYQLLESATALNAAAHQCQSMQSLTPEQLGYRVAAIRECFEEAGILLAHDASQRPLTDAHVAMSHRQEVFAGQLAIETLCQRFDLQLHLGALYFRDRWVTPLGHTRRFDTRFFVARVPAAQTAREDGHETTDHAWLTAAQALADCKANKRLLARPTIAVLTQLSAFTSVAEILANSLQRQREPSPSDFVSRESAAAQDAHRHGS